MMNIKEFMDYVAENVKEYLPPAFENASVTVNEVYKNNDTVLHGILIRNEGEDVTPQIYLDKLYQQYLDGRDIEDCVGSVADVRIETDTQEIGRPDLSFLSDYEEVKPRLMMKICDKDMNVENLQDKVKTLHGDFIATYSVKINETNSGIASMAVRPELLKQWDVTVDQLHADAVAADKSRVPVLMDLADMIMNIEKSDLSSMNFLQMGEAHPRIEPNSLMCLTNGDKMNGASLILHDDVMKQVGEIMGTDYYVLPSSIHETLIVPDNSFHNVEELNAMVKEVNSTIVDPEEVLSDKVQHYDRNNHVLENAVKFENRRDHEKDKSVGKGIKEKLSAAKKEVSKKISSQTKHKDKQMEM